MTNKENILKEANYFLTNDVTLKEASSNLGISKRTLQLHIKKLEKIEPSTYVLVKEKIGKNIKEGNIKGGTIGKRSPSTTEIDTLEMFNFMVENDLTYEEMENYLGLPKSTIYEALSRIDDLDKQNILQELAKNHKAGKKAK